MPDNYDASIYERSVVGTTEAPLPLAQPFSQPPGVKLEQDVKLEQVVKQEESVKCEPGYVAADQKPC